MCHLGFLLKFYLIYSIFPFFLLYNNFISSIIGLFLCMPLLCQTRILLLGFIHYITFISLIFPMRKTVCCFRIWVLVLLFQTKSSINGACSTYFLWIDIFRMLSSTAMPSRLQLVSQIFGIMSSIHFKNCFLINCVIYAYSVYTYIFFCIYFNINAFCILFKPFKFASRLLIIFIKIIKTWFPSIYLQFYSQFLFKYAQHWHFTMLKSIVFFLWHLCHSHWWISQGFLSVCMYKSQISYRIILAPFMILFVFTFIIYNLQSIFHHVTQKLYLNLVFLKPQWEEISWKKSDSINQGLLLCCKCKNISNT